MVKKFNVAVPALSTARELELLFQSLADDRQSWFKQALDLDVSHIDQRAQVLSVHVTQVEIDGDCIHVSYDVSYNVYNGCKDMDIDDVEERMVSGVRTAKGWEFKEFVPPSARSTVDEF